MDTSEIARASIEALERRRRQNRLAQRKRRQRRAELDKQEGQKHSKLDNEVSSDGPCTHCRESSGNVAKSLQGQTINAEQVPPHRSQVTLPVSQEHTGPYATIAPETLLSLPPEDGVFNTAPNRHLEPFSSENRQDTTSEFILELESFAQPEYVNDDLDIDDMHLPRRRPGGASRGNTHARLASAPLPALASLNVHPASVLPLHTQPTPDISPTCGVLTPAATVSTHSREVLSPALLQSNNLGKTALHISAERGNARLVKILLEHDVDLDGTDLKGRTALHYATRGAHVEVVAWLLTGGANPECRDHSGLSPLHLAVESGCEAVVRTLVRFGADLNAGIGATSDVGEDVLE